MNHCFITGISRGLGFELAKVLLAQGFCVTGIGQNDNPELSQAYGDRYTFLKADLRDSFSHEAALLAAVNQAKKRAPETIILVNNAALSNEVGLISQVSKESIVATLGLNLVAPIFLSKLFLSELSGTGIKLKIIHISSLAATLTTPGSNLYNISKAALEVLSKAIESEKEYTGTKCESIIFRPGIMDTEMQRVKRSMSKEVLPSVQKYKDFHEKGLLKSPKAVAAIIYDNLIVGTTIPGKIYSLEEFIDVDHQNRTKRGAA